MFYGILLICYFAIPSELLDVGFLEIDDIEDDAEDETYISPTLTTITTHPTDPTNFPTETSNSLSVSNYVSPRYFFSFIEQFCDIIVGMPSFTSSIEAMQPQSVRSFLETMRIIAPLFLKPNQKPQADSVFHYAISYIKDDADLIKRVIAVQESRAAWGFRATDRTSSLRSQHQHISNSMSIVDEICKNVQSHLLTLLTFLFNKMPNTIGDLKLSERDEKKEC